LVIGSVFGRTMALRTVVVAVEPMVAGNSGGSNLLSDTMDISGVVGGCGAGTGC